MKAIILKPNLMITQFFSFIRWPNLLMLAGIQFLVYFKLLNVSESVLSVTDLIFLVIITICLGASGYVVNDYYDRDIDRINKPDKWSAGNTWSLQQVRMIYIILAGTGFILSLWCAWRLDMMAYIFIYPLALTGLWFYSYRMKCMPVIGNFWVSLFCAGVVAIIALPDILLDRIHVIKDAFWYYILFAFLSTWYREVIKDIEDVTGDTQGQCKTAVVLWGMKNGKIMAIVFGLFLLAALLYWDSKQPSHWIQLTLTVLQGFTVGSMAFVWWAKGNKDFHYASVIVKGIMIAGTLMLFLL